MKPCPVEGCRKRLFLAAIIVHLNDDHRWSREQIAQWLEKNPVTPRPQSVQSGRADTTA